MCPGSVRLPLTFTPTVVCEIRLNRPVAVTIRVVSVSELQIPRLQLDKLEYLFHVYTVKVTSFTLDFLFSNH